MQQRRLPRAQARQCPGMGGVSRNLGAQLGPQGAGWKGKLQFAQGIRFGVLTDVSPAFCLRPLYLVQADLSSLYRLPIIYLSIIYLFIIYLPITYPSPII